MPGCCGRSCACPRSARRGPCRRCCWRHSRSLRRRGAHNRHIPGRGAPRSRRRCRRPSWKHWRALRTVRSRPWVTRPRALSPAWPAIFSRPVRRRSAMRPLPVPSMVTFGIVVDPSVIAIGRQSAPLLAAPSITASVPSGSSLVVAVSAIVRAISSFADFNPERSRASFRAVEAKVARPGASLIGPPPANIITFAQERRP